MSCRRWARAGLTGALGAVLAMGGLVAGTSATAAPPDLADLRAALKDVTYPPPTVVPLTMPAEWDSSATAVSEKGLVAGWHTLQWGWFAWGVWRWDGTRIEELHREGSPLAVDDTGRVLVGPLRGDRGVFLWEADGTVTDIPLGETATDASMNRHGTVAVTLADGAYVVQDGTTQRLVPSGSESKVAPAQAVNDSGQVVGSTRRDDGAWRAFLWQDGALRYLDTPDGAGSQALGINSAGQVLALHDALGPVVWEPDGRLRRLDPAGVGFQPLRIDDRGLAVGWFPAQDPWWKVPAVADARGVRRLPALGGSLGVVREVAPNGLVAGLAWRTYKGPSEPVAWVAGLPVPLGMTPRGGEEAVDSTPYDISSGGRVVGNLVYTWPSGQYRYTAVVWDLVPRR